MTEKSPWWRCTLSFQLLFLLQAELIEPIRLYSGDLIAPLWSPELPLRPKWQWLVPIVSYSLAEYTSPEMAVTSPEMAVAFRRGRANHIIRLVAYSPSWGGLSGCRAHLRSRFSPVGCRAHPRWRFLALVVVSFVW